MMFFYVTYLIVLVYVILEIQQKTDTKKTRNSFEISILTIFFFLLGLLILPMLLTTLLHVLLPSSILNSTSYLLDNFLNILFFFPRHRKTPDIEGLIWFVSFYIPVIILSLTPLIAYILFRRYSKKKTLTKKQRDAWLILSLLFVFLPPSIPLSIRTFVLLKKKKRLRNKRIKKK